MQCGVEAVEKAARGVACVGTQRVAARGGENPDQVQKPYWGNPFVGATGHCEKCLPSSYRVKFRGRNRGGTVVEPRLQRRQVALQNEDKNTWVLMSCKH